MATMLAGMEAWGCRRQGGTSRGYRGRAWRLRGSEVAWAGSEAQAARREGGASRFLSRPSALALVHRVRTRPRGCLARHTLAGARWENPRA